MVNGDMVLTHVEGLKLSMTKKIETAIYQMNIGIKPVLKRKEQTNCSH